MRRCTVPERLKQVPEPFFDLMIRVTDHIEDLHLQFRIKNPNAAATEFDTVACQIEQVGVDAPRVALNERDVLTFRRREYVVCRCPRTCVLIPFEKREIENPGEPEVVVVNQPQSLSHFGPQSGQCIVGDVLVSGNDEDQITWFGIHRERDLLDYLHREIVF